MATSLCDSNFNTVVIHKTRRLHCQPSCSLPFPKDWHGLPIRCLMADYLNNQPMRTTEPRFVILS
jgi:hypothetical protein